jgi:hypothetical protein
MVTTGDPGPGRAPAGYGFRWGAAGLLFALACLSGCSFSPRSTLSAASVEAKIAAELSSTYHIAPPEVHCPRSVPAAEGTRFTCTAILDGQPLLVVGTVTGPHGRFEVHATSAVVVKPEAEAEISRHLSGRVGKPVPVTCAVPELLVASPGHMFGCTADIAGVERQVAVTVVNLAGELRYQVLPYKRASGLSRPAP